MAGEARISVLTFSGPLTAPAPDPVGIVLLSWLSTLTTINSSSPAPPADLRIDSIDEVGEPSWLGISRDDCKLADMMFEYSFVSFLHLCYRLRR
jgi:hypothetical protein